VVIVWLCAWGTDLGDQPHVMYEGTIPQT